MDDVETWLLVRVTFEAKERSRLFVGYGMGVEEARDDALGQAVICWNAGDAIYLRIDGERELDPMTLP